MSGFECSTHRQHWLISPEEQRRKRAQSYVAYCRSREENTKVPIFSPHNEAECDEDQLQSLSEDDRVSVTDHAEFILHFYCNLLRQSCGPDEDCAIKTTWRVPNTAVAFFRRFYIHNSLCAHDPRLILVASLLLAGKTEEEFVAPTLLLRHILSSPDETEKLQLAEECLLQGLGFELQVYHPQSCMHALLSDIKARTQKSSGVVRKWSSDAEPLIEKLLNSEVCLSAIPLTIAVASLSMTEPTSTLTLVVPSHVMNGSEDSTAFSLRQYMNEVIGEDAMGDMMAEVSLMHTYLDEESRGPEKMKGYLKALSSRAVWKKEKKTKKKQSDAET